MWWTCFWFHFLPQYVTVVGLRSVWYIVCRVNGCVLNYWDSVSENGKSIFVIIASGLVPGFQLATFWYRELGVRRSGLEANNTPSSAARVNVAWNLMPTHP
jgi:hypothetical protein